MFRNGDKVRVVSDWIVEENVRNLRAVILKVRADKCAEIKWTGKHASELLESYGYVFPLDELKKL